MVFKDMSVSGSILRSSCCSFLRNSWNSISIRIFIKGLCLYYIVVSCKGLISSCYWSFFCTNLWCFGSLFALSSWCLYIWKSIFIFIPLLLFKFNSLQSLFLWLNWFFSLRRILLFNNRNIFNKNWFR